MLHVMFTESDILENLGKIGGKNYANKGLMIYAVNIGGIGCTGNKATLSGTEIAAFPG